VTLVVMGTMVTFWWVQLAIDVVLLVLFIVVRPKAAPGTAATT
jgi:hypothetical protein